MVAEVSAVPMAVALPPGVRLLPVTGEAGVGLLIDVHKRVSGTDHSRLRRSLLAQLRDHPEVTAMVVAMAGDRPVCGSSFFPVPASPACGAAESCPASAARASTAPWSPAASAGRRPGLPLPVPGRLTGQPAHHGLPRVHPPGPHHALPLGSRHADVSGSPSPVPASAHG